MKSYLNIIYSEIKKARERERAIGKGKERGVERDNDSNDGTSKIRRSNSLSSLFDAYILYIYIYIYIFID